MLCFSRIRSLRLLLLLAGGLLLSASSRGEGVRLSFFCELPGNEFLELTEDSLLLEDLRKMGAEIRLGLTDLSEGRALGVQRLHQAGIPVVAWLLLSKQEGYFFHAGNAPQATARYQDFLAWTTKYQLRWKGIGLDLEPSMEDIQLGIQHPLRLLGKSYRRLYQKGLLDDSRAAYQALITQIQADGLPVELYVLPMVYDERAAGTESFQRLSGIVDLQGLREIPMCYSSTPGFSPAAILSYGREGSAIALGSTGGGIEVAGRSLPPMSWEQLSRDLLLAHQVSPEIHIFSLEGCLEQGFLPRLKTFSFQQTVALYSGEMQTQAGRRSHIQTALQLLDSPLLSTLGVLSSLVLLLWLGFWVVRRLRKRSIGAR